MKKIITPLIIILFIFIAKVSYAVDTYELQFEVTNNKKQESFDLYLLLPKEYIEFAINQSNSTVIYVGADTLKNNTIPGIYIDKGQVHDNVYTENNVEYVQIALQRNEEGKYIFDVLSQYPRMDLKYRIKNIDRDYIVHIDNFSIDDGKCEVIYDYANNSVKQPDKLVIPSSSIILIIILIILVIVGGISYIKTKEARNG